MWTEIYKKNRQSPQVNNSDFSSHQFTIKSFEKAPSIFYVMEHIKIYVKL
jgi:hypothetical protein